MTNPLAVTRRPAPSPVHPLLLAADSYLTDGRRLFRVVSPHVSSGTRRVLASFEDCRTLEVTVYAPAELYAMGLRLVRAAA